MSGNPRVRPLLWVVAALALGSLAPLFAQERATPAAIGIVDLDRVFAECKAGKALQAKLDSFQEKLKADDERLVKAANEVRERAAALGNEASQEQLAALQKEYEEKTQAVRRFRDDKQREAERIREDGLREIERELAPVLEQIQDEMGLDVILNHAAVVSANSRLDITALVSERLNARP